MPTAKRQVEPDVIGALLAQPQRYEFVQAVYLLERWLQRSGVPAHAVWRHVLRFGNSVSLAFPASEIEALTVDRSGTADVPERIRITPAFIGLLGQHGALPHHYTERIGAGEEGPRAFYDLFANRLIALFYGAWRKYRLELAHGNENKNENGEGRGGLLALLLSLAGTPPDGARPPVPEEVAAYYGAAFRQRCPSAAMIERVLHDYLRIPVALQTNVGEWRAMAPHDQASLGGAHACLGAVCALGPRQWRRDLKVGIRLGPLERSEYDDFLPTAPGAGALRRMLSMFAVPGLHFEVRLVLRASDVHGARLASSLAGGGARLGHDAFLLTAAQTEARDDAAYALACTAKPEEYAGAS